MWVPGKCGIYVPRQQNDIFFLVRITDIKLCVFLGLGLSYSGNYSICSSRYQFEPSKMYYIFLQTKKEKTYMVPVLIVLVVAAIKLLQSSLRSALGRR